MKNRLLALALLCALLLSLMPAALGDSYSYLDDYPEYVVESSARSYCYLYAEPSDSDSVRNLGDHKNGEIVKVIAYDQQHGYYFVVCSNGKTGYIHNYELTPYEDTLKRSRYRVFSIIEPNEYCYLYNKPDSIRGHILGQYYNGEYIKIINWDASEEFAEVQCERTKKNGFMRKACLVKDSEYTPLDFFAVVNVNVSNRNYCYLYSEPSSIKGSNRGEHYNGEWVHVVDWDADKSFALVSCPLTKTSGYIEKIYLSPL